MGKQMIDHVIISVDDNPTYQYFDNLVCNLWFKMGIVPILIKINKEKEEINTLSDRIIFYKKSSPNVDTGFQAQVSRLWVASTLKDKTCLISDIDMLPLNKNYFFNEIKSYDKTSLISFSSDAYKEFDQDRQPMCYLMATGHVFEQILNIASLTFNEYVQYLLTNHNYGWITDEMFFKLKLLEWISKNNQSRFIKLKRGWIEGRAKNRIDRALIDKDKSFYIENLSDYYDMHSPRPYLDNKEFIDSIYQSAMNQNFN